jgi:hypothetical protein
MAESDDALQPSAVDALRAMEGMRVDGSCPECGGLLAVDADDSVQGRPAGSMRLLHNEGCPHAVLSDTDWSDPWMVFVGDVFMDLEPEVVVVPTKKAAIDLRRDGTKRTANFFEIYPLSADEKATAQVREFLARNSPNTGWSCSACALSWPSGCASRPYHQRITNTTQGIGSNCPVPLRLLGLPCPSQFDNV